MPSKRSSPPSRRGDDDNGGDEHVDDYDSDDDYEMSLIYRSIDVEDESWSRHDFVPFHCEGQRRYELPRAHQRLRRA
jgi:hypothetical protein